MLLALWHVSSEILASAKALRRPRLGRRIEFTALEIVEMRGFFLRGPGSGQVLVETIVSAMSPGTEMAVLMGLPNAVRAMPFYPGYSGYGKVVSTGKSTSLRKGQYVAGQIGHASIAVVDEMNLSLCEPTDDPHCMAMIELGCIVQQGVRKAQIRLGEHVLVVGAGLLGQMSVIYASAVGAGKTTMLSRSARKQKSSEASLPKHEFIVDSGESGFVAPIEADVSLECVGTSEALITAINHVRMGGRVVNLGSPRATVSGQAFLSIVAEKSSEVIGSHISTLPVIDGHPNDMTKSQERAVFVDLVRRGVFKIPSHTVVAASSSENVNKAFESISFGGSDATILFEW